MGGTWKGGTGEAGGTGEGCGWRSRSAAVPMGCRWPSRSGAQGGPQGGDKGEGVRLPPPLAMGGAWASVEARRVHKCKRVQKERARCITDAQGGGLAVEVGSRRGCGERGAAEVAAANGGQMHGGAARTGRGRDAGGKWEGARQMEGRRRGRGVRLAGRAADGPQGGEVGRSRSAGGGPMGCGGAERSRDAAGRRGWGGRGCRRRRWPMPPPPEDAACMGGVVEGRRLARSGGRMPMGLRAAACGWIDGRHVGRSAARSRAGRWGSGRGRGWTLWKRAAECGRVWQCRRKAAKRAYRGGRGGGTSRKVQTFLQTRESGFGQCWRGFSMLWRGGSGNKIGNTVVTRAGKLPFRRSPVCVFPRKNAIFTPLEGWKMLPKMLPLGVRNGVVLYGFVRQNTRLQNRQKKNAGFGKPAFLWVVFTRLKLVAGLGFEPRTFRL